MSVPNQKVLIIHKGHVQMPPFLQISNEDWMEAFATLTRTAFGVYLYLAANQDGYKIEYSPSAIERAGLMSKGQATKVMAELMEKGYVVDGHFYTQSAAKRQLSQSIQTTISNTMTGRS